MRFRVACVLVALLLWGASACERRAAPRAALPPGLSAPEGAGADPATCLPVRAVHRASGMVLVLVPAGELAMGSPPEEVGRDKGERRHRRLVRRPFYLGETEVTAEQFRLFVEATGYRTDAEQGTPEGGHGRGAFATVPAGDRDWHEDATWRNPYPNLPGTRAQPGEPVLQVSWNDARAFTAHAGLRLPTEAEWEHACRAGTATRYFWGEDEAAGDGYANVADASARRRFPAVVNLPFPFDDGAAMLAPVGRYRPNPWGLHDMVGNVEEWCEDVMAPYPADGADETAVKVPAEGARVIRGGGWVGNFENVRSANRAGMSAASRRDFIGFRVAANVPMMEAR